METPNDRLIRYLQDAHAAEVGIIDVLKDFVDEVGSGEIRSAFQEHLTVTQSQAQRLEQRLNALGSKPSGGKGFLNTLMGKVSDMIQGAHDEYDKATQDLIKAYATEHLEIGMYTALEAYSEQLGDQETAALAREIKAEEKQAAETVFPMIATAAKKALLAPVTA
jgi:ferritin-like metal-binding protein YciE